MSEKVRYETTGGAGDVPGPLTEHGDLPPGVSSGSGLGPGTVDGMAVFFPTRPAGGEAKFEQAEGEEAENAGERLIREENEVYAGK